MENIKKYADYVKDFIQDVLPEFEGCRVYGADLGYTITQEINADGTITYDRAEAIEYIKAWFDEAAEVYQYQVDNFGYALHNPFENPEAFTACMVIEGVAAVLGQCDEVSGEFDGVDRWNDEFELTEEIINGILDYVKEVDEIEF